MIDLRWIFIADGLAIVILLVVLGNIMKKVSKREIYNKIFFLMVIFSIFQSAIQAFTYYWEYKLFFNSIIFANFICAVYFIGNAIFQFLWAMYMISQLDNKFRLLSFKTFIFTIPIIVLLIACIINQFIPIIWRVDSNTFIYERYTFYNLTNAVALLYCIYGGAFAIKNSNRHQDYSTLSYFLYVLPMVTGYTVEALLYGINLVPLTTTASLVTIYINVVLRNTHIDHLTGLYSRAQLEADIEFFAKDKKELLCGAMFDIDKFKKINDTFGHAVGDEAIINFGRILKQSLESNVYSYRFAGDEFFLISAVGEEALNRTLNVFKNGISAFNDEGKALYKLQYSVGSASYGDSLDAHDFIKKLDFEMYDDKETKRMIANINDEDKMFNFEELNKAFEVEYDNMDDYLFVYDFIDDILQMSNKAYTRFKIDGARIHMNPILDDLIYHDDKDLLANDLAEIRQGLKKRHYLRYRWLDRNRNPVWVVCRGNAVKDETGELRYLVGCLTEIGKTPDADNTTGLLTFSSIKEELNKRLNNSKMVAILFGIDKLHTINKHFGFEYGNALLRDMANAILSNKNTNQMVARLHSDKIMLIDFEHDSFKFATSLFDDVKEKVEKAREKEKNYITISAGVIKSDCNLSNADEFLNRITAALADARDKGVGQITLFEEELYQKLNEDEILLNKLKYSINNSFDGFDVNYQGIVDAKTEKLIGAESLLRFKSEGEIISPARFIPILEETELIVPVGWFVISKVIEAMNSINDKRDDKLTFSINISPVQLRKGDISSGVKSLKKLKKDNNKIEFELTESGHIDSNPLVKQRLKKVSELGYKIAIDDFGTGFSNFINVISVNPDIVKIDKIFIENATTDTKKKMILKDIISMAHSIGAKTTVEGVETKEEALLVRELGADHIQGFYYAKPLPLLEFKKKFNL